ASARRRRPRARRLGSGHTRLQASDFGTPQPKSGACRPPLVMIQLSDLSKSFGDRTLLDHVTWQIGDGERVGLCGPNGAGKTTLLRMLARIDEPDSGD